jgi:hypothetical protein
MRNFKIMKNFQKRCKGEGLEDGEDDEVDEKNGDEDETRLTLILSK